MFQTLGPFQPVRNKSHKAGTYLASKGTKFTHQELISPDKL